ncbi:metal-sensing transcriptional repressor [Dehalococcoidia bacterium]|nr:metal-sensing transcriptional repressor [Dehalococcoidia bacterium]MCL0039051.1 metal-sensing transcriptional repressor [Dehalococcoidia bacterium]MCL0056494.1 metal-sensing transcriptional repressor [Dehalococcoidia bacterium]MCL0084166.1 metal-sensing transcriptional repressor [Dehalococcoidia bacterium]MCL0092201.1 metal-sensing transcriptional repressor [Dehalococcoidia bacterium]
MHEKTHQEVAARLSKVEGHLRAVRRMVEDGRDCPEVLLQISAVRAALDQIGRIILEDHLDTCIVAAIEEGSGEKAIAKLKESLARFLH